jgi:cell division protein FtsI/penicillin-binding protein 2
MAAREKKQKSDRARLTGPQRVWAFALCALILTAGARFFQLQVIESERLTAQAISNRQKEVAIPAQRGTIFDRNGRILAQSIQIYELTADPRNIRADFDSYVAGREAAGKEPEMSFDELLDMLFEYLHPRIGIEREDFDRRMNLTARDGKLAQHALLGNLLEPAIRKEILDESARIMAETADRKSVV